MTRPRTDDAALAGTILVLSVGESLLSEGVKGPRGVTVLAAATMSVLLLWRRSHPVAVTAFLVLILVPAGAFLFDASTLLSTFFPVLVLAYSGAAYTSRRAGVLVLAMLEAAVLVVTLLDESRNAGNVYFPAAVVLLCWVGGRTVQTRARHAAELHEAAALAAERREREAQEAVGEERRRICLLYTSDAADE